MPRIDKVNLEISVVLGSTVMPIHQLLRMGRGAVIALDARENDPVVILANDHPIAFGSVLVRNDRIAVEITEVLTRDEDARSTGGSSDGDAAHAA